MTLVREDICRLWNPRASESDFVNVKFQYEWCSMLPWFSVYMRKRTMRTTHISTVVWLTRGVYISSTSVGIRTYRYRIAEFVEVALRTDVDM